MLVYGDTNSTLAGALAGAQARVPVVHVEAGMRSFDRSMPEELNRVLSDHLAELLLCPSETAAENLRAESVAGRIEVVGDVMVDVSLRWQERARAEQGGAGRPRPAARGLPAADRPPGRQRRPTRAAGAAGRAGARRCPGRCCSRCTRARASGCGRAA